MSSLAIRWEIRLISRMGRTRILLHRYAPRAEMARMARRMKGSSFRKAAPRSTGEEVGAVTVSMASASCPSSARAIPMVSRF